MLDPTVVLIVAKYSISHRALTIIIIVLPRAYKRREGMQQQKTVDNVFFYTPLLVLNEKQLQLSYA